MSETSRVVLFRTPSQQFSITATKAYQPCEGEVLVRVTCCTICGSDIHTFCGRRSSHSPSVLGHEIIGIIENWGGETPIDYHGRKLQRGQRITWGLSIGCNSCRYCDGGLPQKCKSLFKYGHSKFDGTKSTGGLADHCVLLPGTNIFAIDDQLADAVVCPANCATATVMAAIRLAEKVSPLTGKRVLIMGLGMLGLTASAICHTKGCSAIVGVDTNPDRLQHAPSFGTSSAMHAGNLRFDDNHKFDIAFDFSGACSGVDTCIQSVDIGGIVIFAGSVFPGDPIRIHPEDIVRRILTIRGIHNYQPKDLSNALEFLKRYQDRFPFAKLVSKTYELSDALQAFQAAETGRYIRVAVIPTK